MVLASLYNFSNDNTLSAPAATVSRFIKTLESEYEVTIDRFKKNKVVLNLGKFQAIVLDKQKCDDANEQITFDNQQIKAVSSLKLLGVKLDKNFNLDMINICKLTGNQLNALIRRKSFVNFEEKKILMCSYFMANFNCCPLVWILSCAGYFKKIVNLQKRVPRFS